MIVYLIDANLIIEYYKQSELNHTKTIRIVMGSLFTVVWFFFEIDERPVDYRRRSYWSTGQLGKQKKSKISLRSKILGGANSIISQK